MCIRSKGALTYYTKEALENYTTRVRDQRLHVIGYSSMLKTERTRFSGAGLPRDSVKKVSYEHHPTRDGTGFIPARFLEPLVR